METGLCFKKFAQTCSFIFSFFWSSLSATAPFAVLFKFKGYITAQLQAELLSDLKAPTPKSGGRANTL